MSDISQESEFILYNTPDGRVTVPIIIGDETVWTTQKKIADIFGVEVPNISKHISNIYHEVELDRDRTVSKMEIVQQEGVDITVRAYLLLLPIGLLLLIYSCVTEINSL